jgi:predicted  nucleic acid-binding Zn-ribbon protein
MNRKLINCPKCGKNSLIRIEEDKTIEKIENILKSRKGVYEKKIALFNVLKSLEIGEVELSEKQRMDCLLQGKFYNELAKQNLREYKKLAINALSK